MTMTSRGIPAPPHLLFATVAALIAAGVRGLEGEANGFQSYMKSYLPPGDYKAYAGKWSGSDASFRDYMSKYGGGYGDYTKYIEKNGGSQANYSKYVSTYSSMAGAHPSSAEDWNKKRSDQTNAFNGAMSATYNKYIPQDYQNFANKGLKEKQDPQEKASRPSAAPHRDAVATLSEPHVKAAAAKPAAAAGFLSSHRSFGRSWLLPVVFAASAGAGFALLALGRKASRWMVHDVAISIPENTLG